MYGLFFPSQKRYRSRGSDQVKLLHTQELTFPATGEPSINQSIANITQLSALHGD